MYPTQESETPEEALARQQAALQSVTALRDELAETAPKKIAKGALVVATFFLVARWLLGRR